jgi:membrane-associated protease RseP (regulator of RpoE activity)
MDGLALLGIVAFVVGLMLSIALHEIGHLVPAKAFGVKVTQYMVGFGSTLWSTRRGETEYGVKAIPFGGYVRMIGMFPPEPGGDPTRLRQASTGPFQALVEDARRLAKEEIGPGEQDRVFYRKPWWKKLIIMLGGPAMNVLIAVVLAGAVLTTYGNPADPTLTPTVSAVSECVVPLSEASRECTADDTATPAAAAGFRAGDEIVAFDGRAVQTWDEISTGIREHGAGPVDVTVVRNGREVVLTPDLVVTERPADPLDADNGLLAEVGFLGVSPTPVVEPQPPAAVAAWIGDFTWRTGQAVLAIPAKMVGVWRAAFGGAERDPMGPVGIVGAGRIGGEIASAEAVPAVDRIAFFVLLLASFNMAIALFNLIPLLPLDGGHAAGAIWEGVKRGYARVAHRPEPYPVDVARALPLAYGIAAVLISMSVLLLYADIVNPIRLAG